MNNITINNLISRMNELENRIVEIEEHIDFETQCLVRENNNEYDLDVKESLNDYVRNKYKKILVKQNKEYNDFMERYGNVITLYKYNYTMVKQEFERTVKKPHKRNTERKGQ